MELQAWLTGFAEALQGDSQNEAAKVIREAIGDDDEEIGGIAKCLKEFSQTNPMEGTLKLNIKVDGINHEVELGGGQIGQAIVVGVVFTSLLALGS